LIDEIKESLQDVGGLHSETHFVSAATYDGLDDLKTSMFHLLQSTYDQGELVPEVPAQEIPVLRPNIRKSTEVVVREGKGVFRIVHHKAVRLARGSNLETWEARVQYHRRLEQLKVTKALKSAGAKVGDTVFVGDWEFDWE
jgi:Obg family GTPase CgtA-like protein